MKYSWTKLQWEELNDSFGGYSLFQICNESHELLGFSLWNIQATDCAHLLKIVITTDFRGRGAGKTLLSSSIEELKSLDFNDFYLEVECQNTSAIRLYERLGFERVHLKKRFYRDGSDAFAMHLKTN